ncbi:toxin TcdB middle/N-terminal domain-containing protein, partial [Thalassospira sp.]|uniref:toxin TcdB middle/N-terminal domain-containing protein n=1 Tax=Thalassospira sp. TaxID=1912094 RepID=UPI0032EE8242
MLSGSRLPQVIASFVFLSFIGFSAASASAQTVVSGDFSGQFDVTASGEASYAIPVSVAPGIGNLIPEVELYYSSGSGNGLVGVGWGIGGLSAITRCSQSLTPDGTIRAVKFDGDDRFCLDGQRLVSVSGDYGAPASEYRTEIDGHAKIVASGIAGSGPEQFEVQAPGGHVLSYGATSDSRIETVAPDGTAGSDVKYWLLSEVEDRLGNVISYRYVEDQTTGSYRISEIGYGGGAAGSEAARVAFEYEARPDARTSYQGGSLASLDQRLTSIRTLSEGTLITSYNMSYLPHEGADAVDMSILSSIEVCDGAGNCRLPLDVSWTTLSSGYERSDVSNWMGLDPSRWAATDYVLHVLDHNGDGRDDWLFQARSSSAASYILTGSAAGYILKDVTSTSSTNADYWRADRRKVHILDFNGDGRSDVLLQSQTTSQASYLLTGGEAGFDDIVGLSGAYWAQDDSELSVVDHNGDGRSDVLLQGKTTAKLSYLALGGTDGLGNLEDVSAISGMSTTHWSADKRKLHVIDYDGDGLSDLLLQGSSGQSSYLLRADRSLEDETTGIGFASVETIDSLWGMSQGVWASNYYDLHVIDVNGDGMSDLLLQGTSGSYGSSLLLGHGDGFVPAQVLDTASGMSRSLWASNNHRLIAYDFNGDGLGDVLLQGKSSGQASYLLTSRSSGFDDKLAIDSLWGMSQADWRGDKHVVHVTDAGGDSTADLVLQAVNVSDKSYLLNSNGEGYPLVTSVETGRGEKTEISYLPLHDDAVYDRGDAVTYPEQQYESGTKVVSSIKHDDGLGGVRTLSYEYEGARIDIERRRFLGFTSVLSKDEDAGTETLTEYRQDVPYLQRIARNERRLSDGRLVEERVNSWQGLEVQAGTATSPAVTDVRLSQAVSKSYEIEGQALPDDGTPTDPVLPTYEIVISAHATNYEVAAGLQAGGVWNGTDAVEVTVTVDEGVVIGSNSASAYALDFTGLPEGSKATLHNNGSIVGYYGTANGGNGGHAVKTDIPLSVA